MSDRAASPTKDSASADARAARPDDGVIGEVSEEKVEVKDSEGVPAAESKEEESVIDEPKIANDITAAAEVKEADNTEKPAEDAPSAPKSEDSDNKEHEKSQEDAADATPATPATASKSNARRKSSGVPEHNKKKLNRKQSKAKMSHLDAKPGDYFFIKLKGYPKWPGIIAADDMLPEAILKSRPVTAARIDGTYREDYADGGKNVLDRTFPVMFLETNEFCWAPNTDLEELDTSTVGDIPKGKMSIALYNAHQLAAENHDLEYFKNLLREFEEARLEEETAKEAAKVAKTFKKGKKSHETVDEADDEDVEMADAEEAEKKPKATKKRKADDDTATPKRTESAKKPKIKLTTTPKTNGTDTPKTKEKKAAKPKSTKKANGAAELATPAEQELDPETKRKNKEKEVLFLRHKLQKGLLTRDQQPKEEEMKMMSEYITKLEGYADLEVSIIRVTKINKVLKGILKLERIPKEEEFRFKERSSELLGKWNKILEKDTPNQAAPQANGTAAKGETNGDFVPEAETRSADPAAKEGEAPKAEEAAPAADADVAMEDAPARDDVNLVVEEPKEASEEKVEKAETDSVEAEANA